MRKKSKKLCAIVIVAAVVLLPGMWSGDSKAQGSISQAEAGDDPINTVTLLYDFDADGIPELVVGDDYDTEFSEGTLDGTPITYEQGLRYFPHVLQEGRYVWKIEDDDWIIGIGKNTKKHACKLKFLPIM
jgi:hypothetical protein